MCTGSFGGLSSCKAAESAESRVTRFDVFLNHRGPDVKLNFVAHLAGALTDKGYRPFLDSKSLVKGEEAFDSIAAALQNVQVQVAVFSKGYAESKWCLNELWDMLQMHQAGSSVIIPVFYGVEPEHLRRPEIGPFAAAFEKHASKSRHGDIIRWKEALREAADITGFDLKEVAWDENKLKEKIVHQVHRNLASHAEQPVPPNRVGHLAESANEVIGLLDQMGDGVGIVGLVGMGGIGKTTLANEIFNRYSDRCIFEKQTFLGNVRRSKTLDLQIKQVRDLLQEEVKDVADFQYWFGRIKGRQVLIVIDDVDHYDQFKDLIPDINELSPGTKIIVTSRCGDVLQRIMGEKNLTYEVKELKHLEARKLFNFHSVSKEKARPDLQPLAEDVADACKGVPLALIIMGGHLKHQTVQQIWEETHNKLKSTMPVDVLDEALAISYEGLTAEEKLMFRDISCHMIGLHEGCAMQIWESCTNACRPHCVSSIGANHSLSILKSRCLVTLDGDGRFMMHDRLRDLGRNIVVKNSKLDKLGERSDLCDPLYIARSGTK